MRKHVLLLVLLASSFFLSACSFLDNKTKAGLQVITGDIPASLFLDGQYLEKSPYIGKDIKPGQYTLRIQPDDQTLIPYETIITLRKGLLSVVTWRAGTRPELSGGVMYELEKLPNSKATEVSVITIPDGAIVSIQGREKEFAPLNITSIEPGEKEFEVSLPSYEPQKHTINIVAGHRTTITVKLAKSEAIQTTDTSQPENTASTSASTQSGTSTRQASASAQANNASGSGGLKTTGSRVRIKPTGYTQDGQEVLRVRDEASAAGDEIGIAPVGSIYPYQGEAFDGWYKISFNGKIGWVSSHFAELLD